MKSSLIPVGSFFLAVALALLSGSGTRLVVARQSGGTTGCECKFEVMSQGGIIDWKTENAQSTALSKLSVDNSATVCVSSEPASLLWSLGWTATNLTVTYTVKINGGPPSNPVVQVLPVPLGGVAGSCRCRPTADSQTTPQKVNLAWLTHFTEESIGRMLQPGHPTGTKIKVNVSKFSLGSSFDCTASGISDCRIKQGPLPMSIGTYAKPKNVISGKSETTVTYKGTCP